MNRQAIADVQARFTSVLPAASYSKIVKQSLLKYILTLFFTAISCEPTHNFVGGHKSGLNFLASLILVWDYDRMQSCCSFLFIFKSLI